MMTMPPRFRFVIAGASACTSIIGARQLTSIIAWMFAGASSRKGETVPIAAL
jgi:hypothetical protein